MTQHVSGDAGALFDEVSLCVHAVGLDLARAQELAGFARERNQALTDVLLERGGVDEAALLRGLASVLKLDFHGDEAARVADDVVRLVPASLAIRYHVMPLGERGDRLRIASASPFGWQAWDDLGQVLGRPLEMVLCPRPVIAKMLKASYGIGADTVERLTTDRAAPATAVTPRTTDLSEQDAANEPTVVNLLNQILTEAIRAGATDIHFEPYENKYRIRYRIDGMLEDVAVPVSVKLLKLALVSRIKIMSNLDITEKRRPQDGRAQVSLAGLDYDLRVSILPSVFGEAVNIRLQSRQMVRLDLESLGFESDERDKIARLVERPHGLILVTGPTGSGKTTTLYTCLDKLNQPDTKIITIEDPVEYWMENILQMQTHEEIGFTFADALRSMLRHDPDVMLVGEIRDRETADIAVRASLTGHLVFATLHTNDASSAFARLLDIGIEPFLAASSVLGVVAQRLVRIICAHCKTEVPASSLEEYERRWLIDVGWDPSKSLRQGRGCDQCRFTGYRGRCAVGEVLPASAAVRRLVQQREPSEQIKTVAVREGMRTLRDAALRAAASGRTTLVEALRVTGEDL